MLPGEIAATEGNTFNIRTIPQAKGKQTGSPKLPEF
jgi:hypothetical protein